MAGAQTRTCHCPGQDRMLTRKTRQTTSLNQRGRKGKSELSAGETASRKKSVALSENVDPCVVVELFMALSWLRVYREVVDL